MPLQMTWVNRNANDDGTRIYRSVTPIDKAALPQPLVTLPPGASTYVDETAERNQLYHYLFETFKGSDSSFSKEQHLGYYPYTGPGQQKPLRGDMKQGYFGRVSVSEMFTQAELINACGVALNPLSISIEWMKFALDGKILFVADGAISSGPTWDLLYNAGLVFGVDGPGPFNSGTPVNQLKVIGKNDHMYRVRLMTGTDDPTKILVAAGRPTSNSEWERLIYPLLRDDSAYPTPIKVDDLATADLIKGVTGSQVLVQDLGSTAGHRTIRGNTSSMTILGTTITPSSPTNLVWRPVLELVL